MRVVTIPQHSDNYAYLVIDESSKDAGIVDCSEASSVLSAVEQENVRLTTILPTHFHYDHVGGHRDLMKHLSLEVIGYQGQGHCIPGCTTEIKDGDHVKIGSLEVHILHTPGHTSDHVVYYFASEAAVFTGDLLFAGGCGRIFEGDATQMFNSLSKIKALPDETKVYFGHEYTEKNLRFALTLVPNNRAIQEKYEWAVQQQRAGNPTTPTTVKSEKATNVFFRWSSPELCASIQRQFPNLPMTDVNIFAKTRALKDQF